MAKSDAKSAIARARKRNSDGSFVAGGPKIETKNSMPRSGDNSISNDYVQGDSWIANPHDTWAKAAPPGITPMAPGVYSANVFRLIAGSPNQIYRNLDEALRSNRIYANAMMNDGAIVAPLMTRIIKGASCNDGLVPEDENDPEQIAACDTLWRIVQKTPDWPEFKRTLGLAAWYGKALNVCQYRWRWIKGERRMICDSWSNIIGDKLVFRTNGQMGYIVHMPSGYRDVVVTDIGRAELFNDEDREALVHHKYFQVDMPYEEGWLAIGHEGFGYRHYLYYTSWLKQQVLEWALLGLQIFGSGGLRVGYFDMSNPASERAVSQALQQAHCQALILFPRSQSAEVKPAEGIEIIKPDGMGLDWFQSFLEGYFGKQIERLLLGYDYDSARMDLYDLLKYDAEKLSQTINRDFIQVLKKYNLPGYKHDITYKIHVPHPKPENVLSAAQRIVECGGEVIASEVMQLVGLTMPTTGRKVLKKTEESLLGGVAGMGGNPAKVIAKPPIEQGNLADNLRGISPEKETENQNAEGAAA